MKNNLLQIINNYGIQNQLRKFNEEVFELNEAIIQYETSSNYVDDFALKNKHIAEEIADVMVMLEQFKLYYRISSGEITEIFWSKVNRQLDRIVKEKENAKD